MIARQSARLNAWLDAHASVLLSAFAGLLFFSLAARARATPFWHDEIYTIVSSRLSFAALWSALRDGLDLMPPLNTMLTHLVHAVVEPGLVATRLPPLVSFLAAALAVFALVRRRTNAVTAWSAAILLCFTMASRFSYEARGYGLAVGAFAVALFAWSEASANRKRRRNLALLTAATALGVWAHYYAVLAVFPILVGQLARDVRAKQIDVGVWLALGAAAVLTVPLYQLVASNLPRTSHFWTRLGTATLHDAYTFVLGTVGGMRFRVMGLLTTAAVVAGRLWSQQDATHTRHLHEHEIAAGLACLALPAVGIFVGNTVGRGVFVERYVLFAAVGIAVVIPVMVWRLGPRNGAGELTMFGLLLVMFARMNYQTIEPGRLVFEDPLSTRPVLARQLDGPDPVVVTGGIDYLPLWYYASASQKERLVYLADPGAELREGGTDSVDAGYLALERHGDAGVQTPAVFLAEHRQFWLYDQPPNWILADLKSRGAVVREEARESRAVLYRVELAR
jgi:hypothetical protein